MGLILNLETSTTNCSVCLAKDGQILALKELNSENYSHAEQLHLFIEEILADAKVCFQDLEAVAVSKGPGSYTGLRIGVSAAKGLCFALDIPLIAIATLTSMAAQITDVSANAILIPVLDARRMEVYSAVFNSDLTQIRETKAEIIEETSFEEYIDDKPLHFMGSGAQKIKDILPLSSTKYHLDVVPSSKQMAKLSHDKFMNAQFEDVAYFEPFYLKDFFLHTKKKK